MSIKTCPKCGAPIKTFDLKPNCRNCGVNILYYTQEDDLVRDAKRAELEFASARIVVAKLRAAFIGGAKPIARIVLILLCAAALVVPFAGINASAPVTDYNISVGGIGAYSLFSDGILMLLPSMLKSTVLSSAAVYTLVLFAGFIVLTLITAVNLCFELLSFINIKRTAKDSVIISVICCAVSVVIFICTLVIKSKAGGAVTVSLGFGPLAAIAVNIVYAVVNYLIGKEDMPLRVHENDFERREMLKKVKSGEVKLDDLTLPVFETEAEKEERIASLAKALKDEEEGKEQE